MAFFDRYTDLYGKSSTVNSYTLSGNIVIENLSNLQIQGGGPNYFLQTDGQGNLSWTASGTGISPSGLANSVQFNYQGGYGGDPTNFFTFDDETTLTLSSSNVQPTINVEQLNVSNSTVISTSINVSDGLAGQYLGTDSNGNIGWYAVNEGVDYVGFIASTSTLVANYAAGVQTVGLTPRFSFPPLQVAFESDPARHIYRVIAVDNDTSPDTTYLQLDEPLINSITANTRMQAVIRDRSQALTFAGAFNSDYPAFDSTVGKSFITGANAYLVENLYPAYNTDANLLGVIYNSGNAVFASNSSVYVNDGNGLLQSPTLTTSSLDVSRTLTVGPGTNAIVSQSSVYSVLDQSNNLGNLQIRGNFTVPTSTMLSAPTVLPLRTQFNNTAAYRINYVYETNTELINMLFNTTNVSGLTVEGEKRFYNRSTENMILLVTWQAIWSNGRGVSGITDDQAARATWLAINGDNTYGRYGFNDQIMTGYTYRASAQIQNGFIGPLSMPGSALIKLTPGSYFSLWAWQRWPSGADSDSSYNIPRTRNIGRDDPIYIDGYLNPGTETGEATNASLGQVSSQKIGIVRLD